MIVKEQQPVDLDQELYSLVKLVSNVMDAYTACLFWMGTEEDSLTLRTVYSLSSHLKHEVKIDLGSGLIGWVARHGRAVNASPFKHDPKTLQLYTKEENIKSFLAVPVKVGKQTKGVLCVDSKKGYCFTPKLQKILSEFANHLSQIIQREAEYQVIKEQACGYRHLYSLYKELNGFHKENIFDLLVNISRQVIAFDSCVLSTLDKSNRSLTVKLVYGEISSDLLHQRFPAKEGVAGLVLRTQKPLLLTDLQSRATPFCVFTADDPFQDLGSFMGIPLLADDEVIGFLGFTSKDPHAFRERDLQIASVLSFQASSAISLARVREMMRRMDKVDSLTGLATHSLLHSQLAAAFQGADTQEPFSLLLLDMDGFGQLNQKYSYQVGDELLKKVARILLRLVRDNDLVARFAGQEFCILLRNSQRSRAKTVAERIRKVIQQTVFVVKGVEIKVTVSIGIASYLEDALSKEELLRCAQLALGKAKKKRNAVCTPGKSPGGDKK